MKPAFWAGKRVVLTGHSGFKGAWLTVWLRRLGARIIGISLPPTTTPSLFRLAKIKRIADTHVCDIRDAALLRRVIINAQPDIVFHLAAQALVRPSYRAPLATFSTNVQGTASVLDALRDLESVRVAVVITTDKVYRSSDEVYPYRETDALGGHDPYSASKAATEIVVASYRDAFLAAKQVAVASARAGNVIGGGDWSEDRLIPDAIRAWNTNQVLMVRHPAAVRPWQHVLEPLSGYIELAEQLWEQPSLAGAYNFGPQPHQSATVREVVELAKSVYGEGKVFWGDERTEIHEDRWLALETAKARSVLGVMPRWSLTESVERTLRWYHEQRDGADARLLCEADIAAYETAFK